MVSEKRRTKHFEIVGRKQVKPGKNVELLSEPKAMRMEIFAVDEIKALSRFWFFAKKYQHVKSAHGEILSIREIVEPEPLVAKNYGIVVRLQTRRNIVNMYKEYRSVSKSDAVDKMYSDLASRHKAQRSCIEIIKVDCVPNDLCKRAQTIQYHTDKLEFPKRFRLRKIALRSDKELYSGQRPNFFVY